MENVWQKANRTSNWHTYEGGMRSNTAGRTACMFKLLSAGITGMKQCLPKTEIQERNAYVAACGVLASNARGMAKICENMM